MPDLTDILAACSDPPSEEALWGAYDHAVELAHERDHALGDPKACVDAFLHARGCGRDIPEFALTGVVAYLRTGKLAKATRWHQNSILAAAARSVRDREYEISGQRPEQLYRTALGMLTLLARCDDYKGDCTDKAVHRVMKWLKRHEATALSHPDWSVRFEYMLDPS